MTETTETTLQNMLTENTGRSFLDSGDHYGRNWELNRGRDFDSEPDAELDVRVGELLPTVNVYHWLKERLEFCPEMTAAMEAFGEENDVWGLALMEQWVAETYPDATGVYGDGKPFTVNSYNGESVLSQVIQYRYFNVNDEAHVCLQIHGGCDVRGGYTDPKVFKLTDMDGTGILMQADAGLGCDNCDASWYTDNAGYNWYPSNDEGDLEFVDGDDLEGDLEFGNGKVVILDGAAYCPCCGKGKLHARVY